MTFENLEHKDYSENPLNSCNVSNFDTSNAELFNSTTLNAKSNDSSLGTKNDKQTKITKLTECVDLASSLPTTNSTSLLTSVKDKENTANYDVKGQASFNKILVSNPQKNKVINGLTDVDVNTFHNQSLPGKAVAETFAQKRKLSASNKTDAKTEFQVFNKKTKQSITYNEDSTSKNKDNSTSTTSKKETIAGNAAKNYSRKLTEVEVNKLIKSVIIARTERIGIISRDAQQNDYKLKEILRQDLAEFSSIPSTGITLLWENNDKKIRFFCMHQKQSASEVRMNFSEVRKVHAMFQASKHAESEKSLLLASKWKVLIMMRFVN